MAYCADTFAVALGGSLRLPVDGSMVRGVLIRCEPSLALIRCEPSLAVEFLDDVTLDAGGDLDAFATLDGHSEAQYASPGHVLRRHRPADRSTTSVLRDGFGLETHTFVPCRRSIEPRAWIRDSVP